MITTFISAAIVGIAIGIVSGLLGVGGGSVMVPVFRLVFGLSAVASTATSLFTIIPTSVSGAVSHLRGKTCIPKLGIALGVGGALTSPIGVRLAQISPDWAVMLGAALVIAYSASTMLHKALSMPRADKSASATGANAGKPDSSSPTSAEDVPIGKKRIVMSVAIGALAGIASGYVGLGGGFLMIPLMISLMNLPMKLTSGTSLIAIIILAFPATVMQCAIGNVNYVVGIATAIGSIPGAFLGAKLTRRAPERALRFTFAGFLGIASILLVLNELGLLG